MDINTKYFRLTTWHTNGSLIDPKEGYRKHIILKIFNKVFTLTY